MNINKNTTIFMKKCLNVKTKYYPLKIHNAMLVRISGTYC